MVTGRFGPQNQKLFTADTSKDNLYQDLSIREFYSHRTMGCFGPVPFWSGPFGLGPFDLISGGSFQPNFGGSFQPISFYTVLLGNKKLFSGWPDLFLVDL